MTDGSLTEHLGRREGGELLKAAEEVAVGVGQVTVQLAEVTVPLPDHQLWVGNMYHWPRRLSAAGQLGSWAGTRLAREGGGAAYFLCPYLEQGMPPNSYLFDVLRVLLGDELEKQDKKLGETREAPASPASGNPRKFPGLSSQLPPTLTWPYPAPRGQWPLVPGCPGFQPLSATLGDVSARASVSSETWKAP